MSRRPHTLLDSMLSQTAPNNLYASLHQDAQELATTPRRLEQSALGLSSNPFVADSIALHHSRALSPVVSPTQPKSARSLLQLVNPNSRHYTALSNDLFEEDEEPDERGRHTERMGRTTPTQSGDPPQSILYHQSDEDAIEPSKQHPHSNTSRSSSISPSRSPPIGFTRESPEQQLPRHLDARPDIDEPTFEATTNQRSHPTVWPLAESPEDPQEPDESFLHGGIRLGQEVRQSLWEQVIRFLAPIQPQIRLTKRQRAQWTWANVEDLDGFLSEVYLYYTGKGIWVVGLTRLINLLTIAFVIGFSTYLGACIDYSVLRQKHRLSDVLVARCASRLDSTAILFIIGFSAILSWQILQFGQGMMRNRAIHDFFEELLGIPDADIQTVPWSTVVNRLADLRNEHPTAHGSTNAQQPPRMDAHDVANRLMRESNYMIALYNRNLLCLDPFSAELRQKLPWLFVGHVTQILEWNLRFCIMRYVFGDNNRVRRAFTGASNRDELAEGLRRRFILMGWINFILSPFLALYLLVYSFLRYFQEYHKNPSSMGLRTFTELSKWKFREYNELPHVFAQRLHLAHPLALTYLDQFPKAKLATISRFIAFVSGSFASVLVLFSLIDPDAFLHFEITTDRSVLFYIGLFGTVLAVARGMVPEDHRVVNPEQLMLEIAEHTHFLPEDWRGRLHSLQVHDAFSQLFQMKIRIFVNEILSVLTTPFILWFALPTCAPQIVDFFREFTIHVDDLGYVCAFGVFDFKRPGDTANGSKANKGRTKLDKSILNFKSAHPDWQPRDQTSSLYLSNLQLNAPEPSRRFGHRSTRFGVPPGLASTTLIAEEAAAQQRPLKSRAFDRAHQRADPDMSTSRVSQFRSRANTGEQLMNEDGYDDARSTLANGSQDSPFDDHLSGRPTMLGMLQEVSGQKRWP